jgi:phospho-N-acetylmuramoyl-pentapeptide-transferase
LGFGTTPIHPFLWVTGSLTMGGLLRYLAIAVRKELLIPLLCGVF